MTDFEEELRDMFKDRRIGQVPNVMSVDDVVHGARRRRSRRAVMSTVGGVSAVAAIAALSFAVVDTNRAAPDLTPAVTPSEPTGEATPPPPTDDVTTPPADDGTTPPADPTQSEEPTGEPDDGTPVLDPETGYRGVTIGMSLDELAGVDGAEINKHDPDSGGSEYCYGTFQVADATGMISVRGSAPPAESDDDFVVTMLSSTGVVETPEGITVGSTLEDVQAAYPDLELGPNGAVAAVQGADDVWWYFDGLYANGTPGGDVVTAISLDGGQNCAG